MLLRRITEHVKAQNWFAVALDFLIVVVGVFIGIQVANWNDEAAFQQKETELLIELKRELESSINTTEQKGNAYAQAAAAGKRSLTFLADEQSCARECWPMLIDFFHASQWQPIEVPRATYDELRRQGLPQSRDIIDAVEFYLAQNANLEAPNRELPIYRSLVRQLIPLSVQEYYWQMCWDLTGGVETYVLDCPKGVTDDVAARTVDEIISDRKIKRHLTEWIGYIWTMPDDLSEQNAAAELAIAAIDAELERR
ncbi:MAG: hypothetical protein HKP25_09995 [Marinicaulis sp.]|nr:hypothetical protein [Marinicaulis sp.]